MRFTYSDAARADRGGAVPRPPASQRRRGGDTGPTAWPPSGGVHRLSASRAPSTPEGSRFLLRGDPHGHPQRGRRVREAAPRCTRPGPRGPSPTRRVTRASPRECTDYGVKAFTCCVGVSNHFTRSRLYFQINNLRIFSHGLRSLGPWPLAATRTRRSSEGSVATAVSASARRAGLGREAAGCRSRDLGDLGDLGPPPSYRGPCTRGGPDPPPHPHTHTHTPSSPQSSQGDTGDVTHGHSPQALTPGPTREG